MSHISKESNNSNMTVEENCSRGSFSGEVSMKKGPWTASEDEILVKHVTENGEGNWNSVYRASGLLRCGKSCRLRWTNHLRPNLKKCAFSEEEEQLILELHAQMGNKWAKMATRLPGRTDNEIKNYWNTRVKRRQRAGLPIYPPHLEEAAKAAKKQERQTPRRQNHEFGDTMYDKLKPNEKPLEYPSQFPDMSFGSMLDDGLGYQPNSFRTLSGDPNMAFPLMEISTNYRLSSLEQFAPAQRIYRPSSWGFGNNDHGGGSAALTPMLDYSASQLLPVAAKLELPSLQYPEPRFSDWPGPTLPSPEVADGDDDSPRTGSAASECVSPSNDGLLGALLLEAQVLCSENGALTNQRVNASDLDQENFGSAITPVAISVTPLDEPSAGQTPMGGSFTHSSALTDIPGFLEEVVGGGGGGGGGGRHFSVYWHGGSNQEYDGMDDMQTDISEFLCDNSNPEPPDDNPQ